MAGFAAFPNKRLCDVVFPGTHDAGIYGNRIGSSAKTQARNIREQADAGVRWFDLRIATVKTKGGGLEQRAYHAPGLKHKTSSAGNYQKLVLNKKLPIGAGAPGSDSLVEMLHQAKDFIRANGDEFLILRFSKCGNMEEVVDRCLSTLGPIHFTQSVNLNEALINTLQGKIITVFDQGDFNKLPTLVKGTPGILPCEGLFNSEGGAHASYSPYKWGLQYFGKYSNTRKVGKNLKKQLATLAQGPASSPELLGMMYWTLTTKFGEAPNLFESIKKRDKNMWSSSQSALTDTWSSGMKAHIVMRAGHKHRQWLAKGYPPAAAGRSAKSFMPNIVMIDFAEPNRCATIWNLNMTSADTIARMGDDLTNVGAVL